MRFLTVGRVLYQVRIQVEMPVLDLVPGFCYDQAGGDRVSVLGQPQQDWDDFLEEARKPRKKWRLSRIVWIAVPVAIAVVILIYRYSG